MNAIILAAGKSSRMHNSGATVHKALLPILGIPNVERTIIMLNTIGIQEIIIVVPYANREFDYLNSRYQCKIINVDSDNMNTLNSMRYIIHYLNDSYIIEADVVCGKNIFKYHNHSTYYVMRYLHPEDDEWNIITNSNNIIADYEIGSHNSPAIFGISFWSNKDCPLLKKHLLEKIHTLDLNDPNIFWDNYIKELGNSICLKAYEVPNCMACEMNYYLEYQDAIKMCTQIIFSENEFFNNVHLDINNMSIVIYPSNNHTTNLKWLEKLFKYYGETISNDSFLNYFDYYSFDEKVFILKCHHREIAFFSFVISNQYILLRRLFIESNYRKIGIGKKILIYMYLYAKSLNKDLRVNVYDDNAFAFYRTLGVKKIYTTYEVQLYNSDEVQDNE